MTVAAIDRDVDVIAARFEALPALVNADADLVRRGRFLSCDFKLGIGPLPLVVSIVHGEVAAVTGGPFLLRPWLFALDAAPSTWSQFLEPVPAPGVHDIFALSKRGLLTISGNLLPFMANLQYVKDVVAKPRADRMVMPRAH